MASSDNDDGSISGSSIESELEVKLVVKFLCVILSPAIRN